MLPRTLLLTPVALVLLSPVLFPTAHADPAPVRQRILMDADWRFQYGVEPVLEHSTSINSWQWHFGDADAWKETTSGPDIFGGKVGFATYRTTLPPNPHPELVPTSDDTPQTWRYTTDKPVDTWFQPGFDDSAWKTGPGVFGHDMSGVRTPWMTGDIWIRRSFTIPANIPAKLNFLVKHDEDAEMYVNGMLGASVPGYTGDYVPLPMSDACRAVLRPGQNILAVHCHQTVGGQGIDVGIIKAE